MIKLFKDVAHDDRKMLNKIFWRSFMVFAAPCGVAYRQAPGFTFSIVPAIERYYPDKDKRAECMLRHMTPYNITQAVGTFAMGLVASMEKENAENYGAYDASAIPAIKTSLMGPLSGIGDALFWGIVRTISASVGISMAATGSIMGPILFFVLYNVPNCLCRYFMTYLGYTLGETFLKDAYQSGFVSILTKCAGILGLIMVGAMTASTVKFTTAISIPIPGGEAVALQSSLDTLFLGLVPLLLTFGCKKLLDKNVNINWIMVGIFVLSLLMAAVHIV